MKILLIGYGNMGSTYVNSFLSSHMVAPKDLMILTRNKSRNDHLKAAGIQKVYTRPGEYIRNASIVIVAVKPQDAVELFRSIKPYLNPGQIILSIMAGKTIDFIRQATGLDKIVRAMPNLPCQIGMGITAFTATDSISREELTFIQNLLNSTGKSLYFNDESMLDAVTALSGSGPAFVYYFMQAMIRAGRSLGFTSAQAELLVEQTFLGAIHLQLRHDYSCDEWIKRVTSKGGTTEAALKSFELSALEKSIIEGIHAAFLRAKELGANNGKT